MNNNGSLQVCKIDAVEHCDCPPSVRWFNCRCPEAVVTTYRALPLNWADVLEEGLSPDLSPTVEAVAEVLKMHPNAQMVYVGSNDRLWGGGSMGETHFELARQIADPL